MFEILPDVWVALPVRVEAIRVKGRKVEVYVGPGTMAQRLERAQRGVVGADRISHKFASRDEARGWARTLARMVEAGV